MNNPLSFILGREEVEFILLSEIKKIEPYLEEEKRIIRIAFERKSTQELFQNFRYQATSGPQTQYFHVKLAL